MPLSPVSKDACIKYVKGSHEWGQWFHPRKFATKKNYEERRTHCHSHREFLDSPDIDGEPQKYELLSWELQVRSNANSAVLQETKCTIAQHNIQLCATVPVKWS